MSGLGGRGQALIGLVSWREMRRLADVLRDETIGGALLLVSAVVAVVWANSPWADAYESMRDYTVGPAALHLDLSLARGAADGLLALFVFVAGLELKREFLAGDLRDARRAAVPVAAAFGGVIVPALLYTVINLGGATKGWAIPTATDIAFALAVLAVLGRNLPTALRTFLLTLAVVDDLIAIVIIAVFYTASLSVGALLAALVPFAAFTFLVQRRVRSWWLLLPLGFATWALVHASGVHATVAGVLLALAVPVLSRTRGGQEPADGLAEAFEHRFRPISAGVAVPVFALMAAGVSLRGGIGEAYTDPIAVGIMVGLIAGKPIGITAATWLTARLTGARMGLGMAWIDMVGLAFLAGMGFTVSLLISELSFGAGSTGDTYAKTAVLTGSLVAALLGSAILRLRERTYRRIRELEAAALDDGG